MPAYVFDKKTNELVKVAGNAANADLKDLNIYSTEERIVGTWIDGKPIYRKVVLVDNTQADFASYHWVKTYATGFIEDISFLLRAKYLSATMTKGLETYFDGSYWGIRPFTFDDGRSTQYAASGDRILIEYTKTTD